jgi:hypothetical protein
VFDLIHFLLKLLLKMEESVQDNTKLVGSLLIGGLWFLLAAEIFPKPLGSWCGGIVWAGWILIGLAVFLLVRRKIRGASREGKIAGRGLPFRT